MKYVKNVLMVSKSKLLNLTNNNNNNTHMIITVGSLILQ